MVDQSARRTPDPHAESEAPAPASEPRRRLGARLVYLLPFTHEDASWFARHSDVRRHSIRVIDAVVAKALAEPEIRYTMEAAWILDDYLRTATLLRREEVLGLLRAGCLQVSPLYGLLDERLAGERARIYNVLIGRRATAEAWGVEPADIAVLNDIFGMDAQTPQVYRKLGIDAVLYSRGDVPETMRSIVYRWVAPDGATWVRGIRQVGYCTGNRLGHGEVEAGRTPFRRPRQNEPKARGREAIRRIEEYDRDIREQYAAAELGVYGLFNGCDYEPLQDDLLEVVRGLRDDFPETRFEIGLFGDFVREARFIDPETLHPYTGDLFGAGAGAIRGADATNIPAIKIPYARMTRTLAEAEALWALAARRTAMPDARPFLTETWRTALLVATHDAICGTVAQTVAEEVNRDILEAERMASRIRKEALGYLASALETRYNDNPLVAEAYSAVNLSAHPRREVVMLPLIDTLRGVALQAMAGSERLPVQVVEQDGRSYAAVPLQVDGPGACTVVLQPTGGDVQSQELPEEASIDVGARGGAIRFVLLDDAKRSASLSFDLIRDRGDTYTLDPLAVPLWRSVDATDIEWREVCAGPVFGEFEARIEARVPAALDADRVGLTAANETLSITARIRVARGSRRADLAVTIDNPGVKDYLLRAVLAVPGEQGVRAQAGFLVREVEAREAAGRTVWDRFVHHQYTAGPIAAGGVLLSGDGLHAYFAERVEDHTEIGLVLLRGVGFISRDDLRSRPGGAASQTEAPIAQCLGRHTVSLSLWLDADDISANEMVRRAEDARSGLVPGPRDVDLGDPLRIAGDVVLLGIKEAEDRAGTVYHLVNYGSEPVDALFDRPIAACMLDETPDPTRPGLREAMTLGPYEIAALRVR